MSETEYLEKNVWDQTDGGADILDDMDRPVGDFFWQYQYAKCRTVGGNRTSETDTEICLRNARDRTLKDA